MTEKKCFICGPVTNDIEPLTSDDFPICNPCVDKQVAINEAKKTAKIPVKGIMLTRAEGPIDLCTSRYCADFETASHEIIANSRTAPKGGAYDKHDFEIHFEDGYKYSGRFDVQHYTYENFEWCIAKHVKDFVQYVIDDPNGLWGDGDHKEAQEFLDKYDLETGTLSEDDAEYLLMTLVGADMHEEPEEVAMEEAPYVPGAITNEWE